MSDIFRRKKFAFVSNSRTPLPPEVWIPLAYLVIAALWIFFSDGIIALLAGSPRQFTQWSMIKGWFFVAVTSGLLAVSLKTVFGRLRADESRLRKLNIELRAISDCNQIIARAADESSLLTGICQVIREAGGYQIAMVARRDNAQQPTRIAARAGSGAPVDVDILQGLADSDQGPLQKCMRTGAIVLVKDSQKENAFADWPSRAVALGVRSSIVVPLFDSNRVGVGALMICAAVPNAFVSEDVRLIEELVSDMEVGIISLSAQEQKSTAEHKLAESEQQLRLAMESAEMGFWIWDPHTGAAQWSDNVHKIFGLDENFFDRRRVDVFDELLHPEDRPRLWERVQYAIDHHARFDFEFRVVLPDGQIRWLEDFGHANYDAQGKVTAMMGTVVDITRRKKYEELIATQRMEMAHLSRVASVGEIGTSLAHELNQPLTAIAVLTGVCADIAATDNSAANAAQMSQYLADVRKEAIRAGDIIKRVRSFIQKRESNKKPSNINAVVSEALELMRPEMRKAGVDAKLRLAPGLPEIEFDSIQIQQVLVNLFQNAVDAMEDCDAANRTLELCTGSADDGSGLVVSVKDNGKAASEEMLQEIFSSYVTTKPQGLGLGLPISRSIIENHGGRLKATRNSDAGMTFEFALPARQGAEQKIDESTRMVM